MSAGDALLEAIFANADDDTARLVYADWLDENDQPERAEFIRVQCQIASIDVTRMMRKRVKGGAKHRRAELVRRERELIFADSIGVSWCVGLPGMSESPRLIPGCVITCGAHNNGFAYTFRRGFPEVSEGLPFGFLRPGTKWWIASNSRFDVRPPDGDQPADGTITGPPNDVGMFPVTVHTTGEDFSTEAHLRSFQRSRPH
jgi:uncharacterized protein (TIGR02996 family)